MRTAQYYQKHVTCPLTYPKEEISQIKTYTYINGLCETVIWKDNFEKLKLIIFSLS